MSRPVLSSSSMMQPPLADERAVVGLDQLDVDRWRADRLGAMNRPDAPPSAAGPRRCLLGGQLVEAGGQPLGQPAGVHEDHASSGAPGPARAAAGASPARSTRGPDRRPPAPTTGSSMTVPSSAHVLDRHDDLDARAACACRRRRSVTGRALAVGDLEPAEEAWRSPRAGAGWPTARCAAAASAQRSLQPLERERQVRAALGGGQRVDLVDDHGLDVDERLARRRGEHQVERLGRGDQQVGRVADQLPALVGRRVAGARCRPSARGRGGRRARRRGAMPASGARRFFSTSTASARSGEM